MFFVFLDNKTILDKKYQGRNLSRLSGCELLTKSVKINCLLRKKTLPPTKWVWVLVFTKYCCGTEPLCIQIISDIIMETSNVVLFAIQTSIKNGSNLGHTELPQSAHKDRILRISNTSNIRKRILYCIGAAGQWNRLVFFLLFIPKLALATPNKRMWRMGQLQVELF